MARRLWMGLEGYLFEGADRWAVGVHFTPPEGTPTAAEVQSWAAAIEALFLSHGTDNWVDELSANAGILRVATRYYGEAGPALFSGSVPANPIVAGVGVPSKPAQCTRVYSLGTGISGRRYRGRVYLPALATSMTTAGKATVPANTAAEFADFLIDAAAAWPGGGSIRPAVYSATGNIVTEVTSVRVGDVLDTQRRRRDALVENYQEAQIPS